MDKKYDQEKWWTNNYFSLLLMKSLSRKRKADYESGLSSLLINEKVSGKRCLCSMDNEKETAPGKTLVMFLAGKKERKHRSSVFVHCLEYQLEKTLLPRPPVLSLTQGFNCVFHKRPLWRSVV